jgi:hypothetical protein
MSDPAAPLETDALRSAFDELRASALPAMRPVGVAQVVTAVRRRRNIRSAVAGVVVVVLVALGAGPGSDDARTGGLQNVATGGGSSVLRPAAGPQGGQPSAVVPPSLGTKAASLGSSASDASPQVPSPASSPPRSSRPTPNPLGPKKPCASDGVGVWSNDNGLTVSEEFSAVGTPVQEPPCAGVSVPLFWASYAANADGTGSLYASGTAALDAAHTVVGMLVRTPATCGVWFVGHDVSSIPSTLPTSVMRLSFDPTPAGPFWDSKHGQGGVVEQDRTPCPPSSTASPSPVAATSG